MGDRGFSQEGQDPRDLVPQIASAPGKLNEYLKALAMCFINRSMPTAGFRSSNAPRNKAILIMPRRLLDYWSAGILPAIVLPFSGGRLFEFRINADVPLAGKMPALQ
jgi:hypothetical protein